MSSEKVSSECRVSLAVGERVTVQGRDGEFVVMSVDAANGLVELLGLKPGIIERDVPVSILTAKRQARPQFKGNSQA